MQLISRLIFISGIFLVSPLASANETPLCFNEVAAYAYQYLKPKVELKPNIKLVEPVKAAIVSMRLAGQTEVEGVGTDTYAVSLVGGKINETDGTFLHPVFWEMTVSTEPNSCNIKETNLVF